MVLNGLKSILGTNVSHVNKNLIIISLILDLYNKILLMKRILEICKFIPKLLSNSLASCSLTNLDFLVPRTTHIDKGIGFICLSLKPSCFYFPYFLYTSDIKITLFLKD